MRCAQPSKTAKARSLRKSDNEAEAAIWAQLRGRRLNGYKFVRQHPIGPYFADFACRERRLVVELDGSQHVDNPRDRVRNRYMNDRGWSVIRFWSNEALSQKQSVLETIVAVLEGRLAGPVCSLDVMFLPAGGGD